MLLRGQGLLLLVVGILVGTVLASIVMIREGLPAPLAVRVADIVAPPQSGLPTSIQVNSTPGGANAGPQRAAPGRAAPTPSASNAARPNPSAGQVTVVPPPVYTYYEHGHGGGGGDGDDSHRH